MADNYLENKMEQHRAGKDRPAYRPRLTPRGTRPGEWLVKFTPCTVHVSDASPETMADVVGALAGIGFSVSFAMPGVADGRRGASLAQRTGARFIPDGADVPLTEILITPDSAAGALVTRGLTALAVTGPHNAAWLKSVVFCAVMMANTNGDSVNLLQNIKINGKNL